MFESPSDVKLSGYFFPFYFVKEYQIAYEGSSWVRSFRVVESSLKFSLLTAPPTFYYFPALRSFINLKKKKISK